MTLSSEALPVRTRQAEESFRLLIEGVKDYGIFMLDLQGNILTWNQGAARIKGYSAQEIIGKNFSEFYTEEDRKRKHHVYELEMAIKEGRYEEEGWRVRKDGSRFWTSVVITRLDDAQGNAIGFGKVTRDLTERKLAEDQLKLANETLEKRVEERTLELQQAIQVRDEFLSIASHELKTPVTPLKLQLQVLLSHIRKGTIHQLMPAQLEKMANNLDRSVNRLVKLIESLLDVSRLNAGKIELHPESVNIAEIIRDACNQLNHEAKAQGTSIDLNVQSEMIDSIDPIRLEQVVNNLVFNAIKFSDQKPISVRAFIQNRELIVEVKDQGIGMEPQHLRRIFDRFEQIKPKSSGGMGLGLYITKQIVDAQRGTISVSSEPGEGSCFVVTLPLV